MFSTLTEDPKRCLIIIYTLRSLKGWAEPSKEQRKPQNREGGAGFGSIPRKPFGMEPLFTVYGNLASIVGLILTLIGFVFTAWKIIQTRRSAEEATRIAKGAITQISTRLFSNQIADGVRLASELRNACRMEQWERAIDRCEQLRLLLASVVEDSNIRLGESNYISEAIDDLGLILRRLEEITRGGRATSLTPNMQKVLDTLTITLGRLNGRLKNSALEIDDG